MSNPYREIDYPEMDRQRLIECCVKRKALLHECRGIFRVLKQLTLFSEPAGKILDAIIKDLNEEIGDCNE